MMKMINSQKLIKKEVDYRKKRRYDKQSLYSETNKIREECVFNKDKKPM